MYIENIKINSFGKLSGREITLSPGINVFEGENESGKSTVAAFIKFVLYGMKGDPAERRRYINWHGTSASGSLLMSDGERRILVERSLAVSGEGEREAFRETVRMTDADTGLAVFKGECPGEALLGVPEDVFSGTAYVRQLDGARIDGGRMSAATENLLFSADEAVNTEKAAGRIDQLRRQLLHKNGRGGSIFDKKMKRDELMAALERAKSSSTELINVDATISELEKKRDSAKIRLEAARTCADELETLLAARRFEKLRVYRARASELSAAITLENGPAADRAYIDELRRAADGMSATSSSIAAASRQLDALREAEDKYRDREELLRALLTDEGAADIIIEKLEGLASARAAAMAVAIVSAVLSVALAVVACMPFAAGNTGIFLWTAAATFAVGAVAAGVAAFIKDAQLSAEKRKYGADGMNMDGVRGALDAALDDAEEFRRASERVATAETELYVQYSVFDDEKREARELLSRLGVESDDDGLSQALSALISRCETAYSRVKELSDEDRRVRESIAELERQLAGVDEAKTAAAADALKKAGRGEYDGARSASLGKERDLAENAYQSLVGRIHELEVRRAQLMATRTDPSAISVKLDELTAALEEDVSRYEACLLATEALAAAGRGVRESVAPRLRMYARDCLGAISGGKYAELGVDAAFGMSVYADGAYRELSYMSGGTVEAAYLSLRLALVKLLYRNGTPPLVFDESFSQLDDGRARAMMAMIGGCGMQALILSCQGREARLLRESGQRFGLIDMSC